MNFQLWKRRTSPLRTTFLVSKTGAILKKKCKNVKNFYKKNQNAQNKLMISEKKVYKYTKKNS